MNSASEEWWFNGRIIQKQSDFRLSKWISFPDDGKYFNVEIHTTKKDAVLFAKKHPCLNPEHLPKNYIGG